jgi:hypothetical protein
LGFGVGGLCFDLHGFDPACAAVLASVWLRCTQHPSDDISYMMMDYALAVPIGVCWCLWGSSDASDVHVNRIANRSALDAQIKPFP